MFMLYCSFVKEYLDQIHCGVHNSRGLYVPVKHSEAALTLFCRLCFRLNRKQQTEVNFSLENV